MIVFDEKKRAKEVLLGIADDLKNTYQIVSLLTRYVKQVMHLDDEENYQLMSQWLNVHLKAYSEYKYTSLITDMIKRAGDKPFYHISEIVFFDNEIDKIKELNDLRLEKVMFIILYLSKYQSIIYGYENQFVSCSLSEIFNLAKVNATVSEKQHMIHRLTQCGYIQHPHRVDSQGFFVMVLPDRESDVSMKITEQDANDPVYVYLKYGRQQKLNRCKSCGKWMRHNLSGICKACEQISTDSIQKIKCIECGVQFEIPRKDHKTYRCNDCQSKHERRLTVQRVRNYRAKCNANKE